MDSKGSKFCDYWKRKGYQTMRLSEADSSIIDQLRNSQTSDYCNTLNPNQHFNKPEICISMDMSFVTVRNGRLAAYVLVTPQTEKELYFNQLSASVELHGKGLAFLPFAAFMEAFYKEGYTTASYVMYSNNAPAHAFRKKLLNDFDTTQKVTEQFEYVQMQ